MVVSDLAFSGVKSPVKGRGACFGDIIHHLVSRTPSPDLASVSDNVSETVLSPTGLLSI